MVLYADQQHSLYCRAYSHSMPAEQTTGHILIQLRVQGILQCMPAYGVLQYMTKGTKYRTKVHDNKITAFFFKDMHCLSYLHILK